MALTADLRERYAETAEDSAISSDSEVKFRVHCQRINPLAREIKPSKGDYFVSEMSSISSHGRLRTHSRQCQRLKPLPESRKGAEAQWQNWQQFRQSWQCQKVFYCQGANVKVRGREKARPNDGDIGDISDGKCRRQFRQLPEDKPS